MGLKSFLKKLKKTFGGGRGLFGALLAIALPGLGLFGLSGAGLGWFGGQTRLYQALLGASLFGRKRKPSFGGSNSRSYAFGGADNLALSGAPLPVVLGEARVTGLRVWQQVAGDTLRDFVVVSEGPVTAVDDVQVNGLPIQGLAGCSYDALLGASTQAKPGGMAAYRAGIPFLAGVSTTLKASEETGANPVVSARVKGQPLKQWNGAAWASAWTDNPAWVIRHLLTLGGVAEEALDDGSFIAFADYCAQVIPGEHELLMTNLAPAATVTGGNGPQYANDRRVVADQSGAQTWWTQGPPTGVNVLGEMNFGGAKNVGRVVVFWWNGDERTYRELLIEYWTGSAWATLVNRTGQDYQFQGRSVFDVGLVSTSKLRLSVGQSSKGAGHGTHLTEVAVYESQPARRFAANLVMDHQRPLQDWLEDILSSCNAFLTLTGDGLLGVDWERAKTATFAFGEEHVAEGAFTFRQVSPEDRPNRIRLTYFDRVLGERRLVQADNTADQNQNGIRVREMEMLSITHGGHAARLCRLMVNIASQVRWAASFTAKPGASLPVLPGDVVTLTHRVAGWVNKPFLVDSVQPGFYEGVRFDLVEYRPEIFGDTLGGWTLAQLGSTLQNPLAAPPHPTGLLLSESQRQLKDGAWLPSIVASFTFPATGAVKQVLVQLSRDGGTTWQQAGVTDRSPFEITGLANGAYRVRLISVNSLGVRASELSAPWADLTIVGKSSAASGVTGFSGSFTNELIRLVWNPVADADVKLYRVKKATAAGDSWASAALFAETDATELIIEATPGMGRGPLHFQVKAVDRSGNESSGTQGAVVSVQNTRPVLNAQTPVVQQAPPNAHRVSWQAITTDPDIALYEIHRSAANGFTPTKATLAGQVSQGNATGSFTLTFIAPHEPGVTPGSTYYYRVVAVDRAAMVLGDAYDSAVSFTQQAGLTVEAPAHPTGLTLTEVVTLTKDGAAISNLDVSWTNPGGERFSHVAIELAEDVGGAPGVYKRMGTAAKSPFRLGNLRVATWWVRLIAVDLMGNEASAATAPAASIALDGRTDAAALITGFVADYTSDVIRLSWNPVADSDLSHYVIRQATGDGQGWSAATVIRDHVRGTTVLIPALEAQSRGPLYFQIKAVNRSGVESSGAQGARLTTQNDAPAFTGVTPTVVQNPPNSHLVRFNALASVADMDRYEIHRSTTGGFTPTKDTLVATVKAGKVQSGATAAVHEAVVSFSPAHTEGTTYYYRVQALDTVSDIVGDQYAAASRSAETSAPLLYIQSTDFTPHLRGSVNRRVLTRPTALLVLGNKLYVTLADNSRTYRYDPATGELVHWLGPQGIDDFAWDGTYVYTLQTATGLLKRWANWQTSPTQDTSGDPWVAGGKNIGVGITGIAHKDTQSGQPRFYFVEGTNQVGLITVGTTVSSTSEIDSATAQALLADFDDLNTGGGLGFKKCDYHAATGHLWLLESGQRCLHRLVKSGSWSLQKSFPAIVPSSLGLKTVYDGTTPRFLYQISKDTDQLAAVSL